MSDQPCIQFVVLFTAQKVKKSKTWQDGLLKFYDFNKKMVLIDEKGYNIDRKFQKGKRPPQVGDEIEFDGHLVTVENVAEVSGQPESVTDIPSNPQITHLETRRRNAQQSAALKLKLKWRPPTMLHATNDSIKCEVAKVPEREPVPVPVIEVKEHEEADDMTIYTKQIPTIPKATINKEKENIGTCALAAYRGHKQAIVPSRSPTLKKQKASKSNKQDESKSELGSICSITDKDNDKVVVEFTHPNDRVAGTGSRLPAKVETFSPILPTGIHATDTSHPAPEKGTPPIFHAPVVVDDEHNMHMDTGGEENIAGVEEELGSLHVQESLNVDSNPYEEDNTTEYTPTDMQLDEVDGEVKDGSNDEDKDEEDDDQEEYRGRDVVAEPASSITPTITDSTLSSFFANNDAQAHKGADKAPDSMAAKTGGEDEDMEMRAGIKRSTMGSIVEELPSAKRRIKVGLSKAKKPPVANKSFSTPTNTVGTSFVSGSFVKASDIQRTTVAQPVNPSNSKPPNSNAQPSSVQRTTPPSTSQPAPLIPMVNSTSKGFTIPSIVSFPNASKVAQALKTKKGTSRKLTVPTRFNSVSNYVETFTKLIQEHLQVLLQTYATYFHAQAKDWTQVPNIEQFARSRGLGLHMNTSLSRSDRYIAGDLDYCLTVRTPQHRSKYGKDDIWVISKSLQFEPSSTFLAKSTFYGPVAGSLLEIQCLTPRDGRIAAGMCKTSGSSVALRTVSASSEFMMLSALVEGMEQVPLVPAILSYDNGTRTKKKQLHPLPSALTEAGQIVIHPSDGIDVPARLNETIKRFTLNEDQARVLVATAESVIKHPKSAKNLVKAPVILVHGVFGSGKSYLAAVLIMFIQELVDDINAGREPEDRITYRILVTSITNVAVDRILLSLLDLGYEDFVRVGSLRKIAKAILPHTIQSRVGNDADLKELEAMLKDEAMSSADMACVEAALQKFQKAETHAQMSEARVIGTTCVASVFEIFNEVAVPLILLDEASQIMEPMAMVPITKFCADRLILIGDPLQLPPTLVTPCEPDITGQGIEKTLFDRCAEMGIPPIMLRTQYRCHPRISRLSNNLFYERRLINGIREADRPPLFTELPPVCFVNTNGSEMKRPGTQSFHNDGEMRVALQTVQALVLLGVSPVDIGIISLYKEQADKLQAQLKSMSNSVFGSVQVSTVDAFQGAEKEVIILCTVRTNPSNFIDNPQRVNVALSRAKRHLIMLGKQDVLSMNQLWSCIIKLTKDACLESAELTNLLSQITKSRRQANLD